MPSVTLLLAVGLAGSLLMFAGDMLLYFTKGPYEMDGTLKPYAAIMKDLPERRVFIGGALGPVAAFLYLFGFAALGMLAQGEFAWAVWLAALLLAFALVCGGTYHAQYVYLGLAGKAGSEELLEKVTGNIGALSKLAIYPMYAGFVLLGAAVLFGQTVLPAWFVLLTPLVTSFLGFIWLKVPQPARCVLFGGWSNLVFTIMFAAALVVCAAM